MYINTAHIYGNLTRDPELRALPDGGQVCSFSVATNRQFKKKDGAKAEETTYHNIVVFGRLAETCAQYLKKGAGAYIEGRLQTRSWDGEKGKQSRTEIVAEKVQFGPRPAPRSDVAPEGDPDQRPLSERQAEATAGDKGIEYPEEDINPDDIPF